MGANKAYPVLDGGWGWVIVLAACIGQVMFGMICRCTGIFYMEFQAKFDASATATSWVFALLMITWSGLGPVTTTLCGKYGCRVVATVGGCLMFVGLLGAAFAPSIAVAYVTMGLILGVGMAFNNVPGMIMVGEYFEKRKGLAMAVTGIGSGIGAFSFAPLLQLLFLEYGYTSTMMLMAALAAHSLIGSLLFRPLDQHYGPGFIRKRANSFTNVEEAQENTNKDLFFEKKKVALSQSLGDLASPDQSKIQSAVLGQKSQSCRDLLIQTSAQSYLNIYQKSTQDERNADEQSPLCSTEMAREYKGDGLKNKNHMEHVHAESEQLSHKETEKGRTEKENCLLRPLKKLCLSSVDWSLFTNQHFIFMCLLSMTCSFCFATGITFLPAMAVQKGVTQTKAAFLISAFGFLDVACMIPVGFLFDLPAFRIKPHRRVAAYCLFASSMGLTCALFPVSANYGWLLAWSLMRGIGTAVFMSQRLTVLADLLSKQRAPKALGFQLLSFAIGSVIARTSGGLFMDFLGQYDPLFYIGGVLCVTCSLVFTAFVSCKTVKSGLLSSPAARRPLAAHCPYMGFPLLPMFSMETHKTGAEF